MISLGISKGPQYLTRANFVHLAFPRYQSSYYRATSVVSQLCLDHSSWWSGNQVLLSDLFIFLLHQAQQAFLDNGTNSWFMDKDFARLYWENLRKLLCPTSVLVIDGHPSVFGKMVEEYKSICVILDNLACEKSFNINQQP